MVSQFSSMEVVRAIVTGPGKVLVDGRLVGAVETKNSKVRTEDGGLGGGVTNGINNTTKLGSLDQPWSTAARVSSARG